MYHSTACRSGKEFRTKQRKLTVRKLIEEMIRFLFGFSLGVTLVFLLLYTKEDG
jgi:hypothetical protein